MLLAVLLVLPLYIMIFGLFYRFRRLIKAMTEIDEFLAPLPDHDEQESEEASEREFLVDIINQGKADKLPSKTSWTVNRIRKTTEKVVENLYHEYHQADAKHKAEMTGKAVSAHVASIYSKGVSRVLKIDSVE